MKRVFFVFVSFLTTKVIGQNLTLQNTWRQGSDKIYLDIANEMVLNGDTKKIKQIRCSQSVIVQKGDTLVLTPTTIGLLKIIVVSENGEQDFEFTTTPLPSPFGLNLGLTNNNSDRISVDEILNGNGLQLWDNEKLINSFYSSFHVDSYNLTIANQTYKITSKGLPDDVRNAISKLKIGEGLYINNVKLSHNQTGKILTFNPKKQYQIIG